MSSSCNKLSLPQMCCSLRFCFDSKAILRPFCRYSEISTRLYPLKRGEGCMHTRHLRSRTSLHNFISLHKRKSSVPIKFPFPYSPMIFAPHTCCLALVRVAKNKKMWEKVSCLAIFSSVTEGERLPKVLREPNLLP